MMDLRNLYQEVIVDHSRKPRNFGELADANRSAEGYNPLCGDKLTIFLHLDGDVISKVRFKGCGCAISMASASLLTETLTGKTIAEAQAIFTEVHDMLTLDAASGEALGKLKVLAGVKAFPARVKCATLAWHTFTNALDNKHEVATTE